MVCKQGILKFSQQQKKKNQKRNPNDSVVPTRKETLNIWVCKFVVRLPNCGHGYNTPPHCSRDTCKFGRHPFVYPLSRDWVLLLMFGKK